MRRRQIIAIAAIAAVAVVYVWLGRSHVTRVTFDSTAYLEAAAKPFSFDQFAYPKPMFVSLVYRVTGDDVDTIAIVQRVFALLAWSSLGLVATSCLRTRRAQLAAAVVVALFALDPVRRGFADVILAESITDSLCALGLALALLVRTWQGRRQLVAAVALAVIVCMWTLARDTNAIAVLVAAVAIASLWRSWRVLALLAAPVLVAIFVLISVNLTPSPTRFSVQAGWPIEMTPRGSYAQLDNIVDRVIPDAADDLRARGMPQVDEVLAITKLAEPRLSEERAALIVDERYAPARTWIAREGRAAYVAWLAHHPFARLAAELASNTFVLLGAGEQSFMPKGWKLYGKGRFLDDVLGITANRVVIVLALLAGAGAIWRRRQHPALVVAAIASASGLVASVLAFYADTSEPARHCYGHGQQVLIGCYLAALLWLERD